MDCDNQHENVIIGGGVAGLAAANHLSDHNIPVTLIDAGSYPSHKVCGEFFSPECHAILEKWDVLPKKVISSVTFCVGNKTQSFKLPQSARSGSRFDFDNALIKRLEKGTATVYTNTQVVSFSKNDSFILHFSNGQTLYAKNLFIGTGRVLNLVKKPPVYMGFKRHFENPGISDTLQMHLFKNAYLGISPIEDNKVNIACLAKIKEVKKYRSPQAFIDHHLTGTPFQSNEWMTTFVPAFQTPTHPKQENLYLIGDALGAIEPATGDGLAMGITSGVLAADCVRNNSWNLYCNQRREMFNRRLKFAKLLHWLMQHPSCAKYTLNVMSRFPSIFEKLYLKTRT